MDHCFNLLKIADRVRPEKVNKGTFYNNLISSFRGADTLTIREIDDTVKVIEKDCKDAISHLKAIKSKKLLSLKTS